jgi:hypothetical protein
LPIWFIQRSAEPFSALRCFFVDAQAWHFGDAAGLRLSQLPLWLTGIGAVLARLATVRASL